MSSQPAYLLRFSSCLISSRCLGVDRGWLLHKILNVPHRLQCDQRVTVVEPVNRTYARIITFYPGWNSWNGALRFHRRFLAIRNKTLNSIIRLMWKTATLQWTVVSTRSFKWKAAANFYDVKELYIPVAWWYRFRWTSIATVLANHSILSQLANASRKKAQASMTMSWVSVPGNMQSLPFAHCINSTLNSNFVHVRCTRMNCDLLLKCTYAGQQNITNYSHSKDFCCIIPHPRTVECCEDKASDFTPQNNSRMTLFCT